MRKILIFLFLTALPSWAGPKAKHPSKTLNIQSLEGPENSIGFEYIGEEGEISEQGFTPENETWAQIIKNKEESPGRGLESSIKAPRRQEIAKAWTTEGLLCTIEVPYRLLSEQRIEEIIAKHQKKDLE